MQVVRQLMSDIEDMQRAGISRLVVDRRDDLISVQDHMHEMKEVEEKFKKEKDDIRAELDESYGEQIVLLKQKYEDTHLSDAAKMQRQIKFLTDEKYAFFCSFFIEIMIVLNSSILEFI